MSKKRKVYTTAFKTKLVLEVLKGEKTLNEIASQYQITPKNLQNWKKKFLSNAELAMEPSQAVSGYKEELKTKEREIEELQKQLGKHLMEKEWVLKKLKSLGLNEKQSLVESKLKTISITRQCELLELNRSSLYYKPVLNRKEKILKEKINSIFEEIPIYGGLKVHQQLLREGVKVSVNTVFKYRKELGLKAVLGKTFAW
jgi:putative transposase